ncbi:DUF937 domain-containing protein [Deinococcus petrolearius]|uniref:DUF937 domain-containing protein n=1 Tax=Deinococcus petrolearius TaxID=1751295 RepID=A0ABW1DLF5_9DEIO
MTSTQDLQSYFAAGAARLGEAAGLDPQAAARTLAAGLPRQLAALAAHAALPEGREQVQEAVSTLPAFGPVAEVLDDPAGAEHLEQAGALLAPVLLGDSAPGGAGGETRLLHMVLPLVLSRLGRQGDVARALADATARPLDLGVGLPGTAVAGLAGAVAAPVPEAVRVPGLDPLPDPAPVAAPVPAPTVSFAKDSAPQATPGAASTGAVAAGTLGTAGLLEFLRAQLSGRAGDQIGRAAGFSAGTSGRAVAGALPVVLNAVANRGATQAGAAELLRQGEDLGRLTTPAGSLNGALLGDSAEMARLEGQGRGLLGGLFGNHEAMTGRLGTALGGSGASAGRLLALLTPLVLALLARHTQARSLGAAGLSTELAALGPQLPGLLPPGMGGLTALLGAGALAGGVAVAGAPAPAVVARAAPAPTPTPPAPAVPTPPPPASPAPERRRAFPWWLIPLLLLLLLGGCWLVNRDDTAQTGTGTATTGTANTGAATTGGAEGGGIVVTSPVAGADLPAQAFTMSGTAPAGQELRIEDRGQEVAAATADVGGNWSAELPAPTPGEHTYSVIGGEGVRSEFKVNVTADGAAPSAATGTTTDTTGTTADGTEVTGSTDTPGTGATAATAGAVAFSQPASGAEVPAAGLSLSGTGPAGQSYEVLEDGTSIGNVTVEAGGTWTLAVPAATPGAKTYVLRGADGQEAARLPLTVTGSVAGTGATGTGAAGGAACTEALTVSLKDGETVSAPYRFGGVGSGEGYTVTVKRGERVVGTRSVALGDGCAWNYTSNPGGRDGRESRVTYEVRPRDAAPDSAPEASLTLTVRGSGANFQNGEYVGPTRDN